MGARLGRALRFFVDIWVVQTIPFVCMLPLLADKAAYLLLESCIWWFNVKFVRVGKHEVYRPPPGKFCIWLANHRSWGDFFIDNKLTGIQAAYLSRWMVMLALPLSCFTGYTLDRVWFFKRPAKSQKMDMEWFYKFLDERIKATPWRGLIVYPEGTRNSRATSLPLKWGCVRYAYDRKIPVQIIITTNKERVLDEKRMRTDHNVVARTCYSEPIDPSSFDQLTDFTAAIQRAWDAQWELAYNSKEKGVPYVPPYVPNTRVRFSIVQLRFLALVVAVYGCIGLLAWWIFF